MKNKTNQKAIVEISVKFGPSFEYQLPDSYIKFNEDLYKKGYPLSNSELSYINSEKKKILIKSKNDFISLLRYVRSIPNKITLFYEKEAIDSFINDLQFVDIKNIYSDLDMDEEKCGDISELSHHEQTYNTLNTLNTINEIVDNIDKGSLFQGIKILCNALKKKCFKKIIKFINEKHKINIYNKKININKIPSNKISEPISPIKLKYNLPSIESLLQNNKLDLNGNDNNGNNNDILDILTSHYEKIENNRNTNMIFQTMINSSKMQNLIDNNNKPKLSNNNDNNNNKIFQSEMISSPLIDHFGFKCNNCNIMPIKNKRYKCPKCLNYNLCEKCEEKNAVNSFHPHTDFILMRNPEKNFVENPYSYQCLTKNLEFDIKKEENMDDEIIIKNILIKNNFILPWPGNQKTFFKCDKSISTIFCEKIFLPNLVLGNTTNINIVFKKTNKIPKGKYKCVSKFIVNNEEFGTPLEIFINII